MYYIYRNFEKGKEVEILALGAARAKMTSTSSASEENQLSLKPSTDKTTYANFKRYKHTHKYTQTYTNLYKHTHIHTNTYSINKANTKRKFDLKV